MATFNNGESGLSVRTKINNVLQHTDGTASELVINDAGADVNFRVESDTNANALFVDGGTGNVGIGTSSPTVKLHVEGADNLSTRGRFVNSFSGTTLQLGARRDVSFVPYIGSESNHAFAFITNDTERMRITSTGNVGIGTSSPASALDVVGTVTADGLTVENAQITTNFDTGAFLRLHPTATTNSGGFTNMFFGTSTTDNYGISIGGERSGTDATPDFVVRTHNLEATGVERFKIQNNGDISFYEDTGTTPKFFWDASAERLGIGTTSPSDSIEIDTLSGEGITLSRSGTPIGHIYDDANNFGIAVLNSNSITFDTGGSEAMRITSTGNVGIGTSSPKGALDVIDGISVTDSNTSLTTNTVLNGIDFYTSDLSFLSNTVNRAASIAPISSDVVGQSFSLGFYTASTDTDATERMRIDASGNLLVGTTTTDVGSAKGFTALANGLMANTVSGGVVSVMNRLASDGEILRFRKDGTTVGSIASTFGTDIHIGSGDTRLRFVDDNDYIRAASSDGGSRDGLTSLGAASHRFKDLYLSGGVYLGGTGAANLLDDYEEGTFTPVVADASSGGNEGSATDAYGYYTKIGRQVTVQITFLNIDTTGLTGANDLYITGVPFAAGGLTGVNYFTGSMSAAGLTSSSDVVVPEIIDGTSYVRLREWVLSGLGTDWVNVTELTSGIADLNITLTYFA